MRNSALYTIIAILVVTILIMMLLSLAAAFGQEMPTIAAADAIYDIYRVPEPVPLPSVAIYIDDNGHMVAKDEKGVMVDFDALGLNCDIMARDFEAMATMLRKIGDMGRKSDE